MTESTTDVTPAEQVSPPSDPTQDKGLVRLVKVLIGVLILVVIIFGVVYYFGQRKEATPSIADQAVTTSEQLVRDHPNDAGARLALAASYAQVGRTEEALGQYQELLKFAKDNRIALMGAGRIMFEQGDFAGAQPMFDSVVKQFGTGEFSSTDPQLEEAYYFRGAGKVQQGDAPGGVEDLQKALAIDQSDADAWYLLGNGLTTLSDFEGAVNAYRQALTFVPTEWCEPYEGLRSAYEGLQREDGMAYAGGMLDVCQGKFGSGSDQLKTVETGEFALQAALGLGIATEKSGEQEQAIAYYKKVLSNEPTNVAALAGLARLGVTHEASPAPSATATGKSN